MIYIHGKGGHGRVIADAAAASDRKVVFTDDAEGTRPPPNSWFIVGIGDNRIRAKLGGVANVVHPAAVVCVPSKCGQGIYIGALAVVNPGVSIGDGAIINTAAVVEHDCTIGPYCHVAPHATLCGGVKLGAGVFIGAGAVVKPGVSIGDWAVVGCGSAVITDIPAGEAWAGVPARQLIGAKGERPGPG